MDELERERVKHQRDQYVWLLLFNRPPRLLRMLCRQRIAECNRLLSQGAS